MDLQQEIVSCECFIQAHLSQLEKCHKWNEFINTFNQCIYRLKWSGFPDKVEIKHLRIGFSKM